MLALGREGYRWTDVSVRDVGEVLRFPGTWRLARKYARTGVDEVLRSFSRRRFAADLGRLVPAITAADMFVLVNQHGVELTLRPPDPILR